MAMNNQTINVEKVNTEKKLTYWMLGRKKLNSTRVIWILLIFSIVLSGFGILA